MPPITTAESSQDQSSSSSALLKERRFKLSRACDRCRRRRIKCDEGHPCQACMSASSACTFEEPGKRSHPQKSKRTATLEDRMHHLETLIQAIPPAVFAAGKSQPQSVPDLVSSPSGTFKSTTFPAGVPPPSLHVFPLTGPSAHFKPDLKMEDGSLSPTAAFHSLMGSLHPPPSIQSTIPTEIFSEETSRTSLYASYLYFDDEGYTRWQGETSGLPLLDMLLDRHSAPPKPHDVDKVHSPEQETQTPPPQQDWFPNRTARRTNIDPGNLWRLITSYIVPELMDSLVQCYLSTSYYILPFLHVPTFLADYGNPQKWGEPGFGAFIVAICCLASRHIDDPRVRADPSDGISAGTQWYDLLGRLRTLPIADRPTLYTIQADLIAAVYAVGLGRLSRAAALLSEAVSICIDAGLHRSAETYDIFDPITDEVRKRTFWCVYIWDKQLSAHFGRPPMIRMRDCDVGEPQPVDDEYITKDGIGTPPPGTECRLAAFICSLRILVVLESVLDIPPPRHVEMGSSPFLVRAAAVLARRKGFVELREEEALLDEIHRSIPPFWAHSPETLASEDTIRLTQAERLHCAEHFVRLLIYRHRFSQLVEDRMNATGEGEQLTQTELEKESMIAAHNSALQIITAHLNVARKGLMTYYGVHVIHQLTQAGRTLVAVLLNCNSKALQHLIPPGLDALRSCVGLLRRFSGRYVCGLRSGDLMEEFCRLTQIPLEPSRVELPNGQSNSNSRPAWIRPVRKKNPSTASSSLPRAESSSSLSQHSSPEAFSPSEYLTSEGTVASGSSAGPQQQPPQSAGVPVGFTSTLASTSGATTTAFSSDPGPGPSPYGLDMESSVSMGGFPVHAQMLPEEQQTFLSPSEVMAMFDHSLDMQMFTNEYVGPGEVGQQPSNAGFGNEPGSFIKMNNLVSSP